MLKWGYAPNAERPCPAETQTIGDCLIGVGGSVVGEGSWVVGLRSPMYTRHCILIYFYASRNSGFVRNLFLACSLSDS